MPLRNLQDFFLQCAPSGPYISFGNGDSVMVGTYAYAGREIENHLFDDQTWNLDQIIGFGL